MSPPVDYKTKLNELLKGGTGGNAGESRAGKRIRKMIVLIFLGTIISSAMLWLPGFPGVFTLRIIVIGMFLAWFGAVSLLLENSGSSRIWKIILLGVLLCIASGRIPCLSVAYLATVVFLFFRKYKPYKLLTSRQRVVTFLLFTIGMFSLLSASLDSTLKDWSKAGNRFVDIVYQSSSINIGIGSTDKDKDEISVLDDSADNGEKETSLVYLFHYLKFSLLIFYFLSLAFMVLRIRLHFLKLRPKLAIAAFLFAGVPFVFVVITGTLLSYHMLGNSSALRVKGLLEEWAALSLQDPGICDDLSGKTFMLKIENGNRQHIGYPAPWIDTIADSWLSDSLSFFNSYSRTDTTVWSGADTTFFINEKNDIWLVGIRGTNSGGDSLEVYGAKLDDRMLGMISDIFNSTVRVSVSVDSFLESIEVSEKESALFPNADNRFGKKQKSGNFLQFDFFRKDIPFGMFIMDVIDVDEDGFKKDHVFVILKKSLLNITKELFSKENPFSLFMMMILGVLVLFMLFMEIFALYFGIRISSGILSAINALVKGTVKIADGDLDTRINIQNEDELGHLANSFNLMTVAVRRGIEEAVKREQMEEDLRAAREIQKHLLPSEVPKMEGFDIAGISTPCRMVGGDYFDFPYLDDNRLGVAIGDVSGKGIPASLLMANIQASLRSQLMEDRSVAEVVEKMNELLVSSTDAQMFASFVFGILDSQRSLFTATNAGHNPPLIFRKDGTVEKLETGGLLLGIMSGAAYEMEEVVFNPGDAMVLFTDGITESLRNGNQDESAEMFGEDRLIETITPVISMSAVEIIRVVLMELESFTNDTPASDDVTIIVIKKNGE